jgi:uncharacterized protein YpmS
MTTKDFDGQIWRWLVASVTALSILIGGVFWLAKVSNTADRALSISERNEIKIENLTSDLNDLKVLIVEIRGDVKNLLKQNGNP